MIQKKLIGFLNKLIFVHIFSLIDCRGQQPIPSELLWLLWITKPVHIASYTQITKKLVFSAKRCRTSLNIGGGVSTDLTKFPEDILTSMPAKHKRQPPITYDYIVC